MKSHELERIWAVVVVSVASLATSAQAVPSLTAEADQAVYFLGETIPVTITGSAPELSDTDLSVTVDLGWNPDLVLDETVVSTTTLESIFPPTLSVTWLSGPLEGTCNTVFPDSCRAFDQLVPNPMPISNSPVVAVLTFTAAAPA